MWKTGSKTGAQAVVSITPTLSKYKTYLLFAIIQNVTNDSLKTRCKEIFDIKYIILTTVKTDQLWCNSSLTLIENVHNLVFRGNYNIISQNYFLTYLSKCGFY
jgi:hypothetical protein